MPKPAIKYLVTGSEGFIGRAIRKNLISQGAEVVTLEDDFILKNPNWKTNLTNLFASNNFSGVFHVGAVADTQCYDVNHMMLLNYQFTVSLTDICLGSGVKIVYSSSAACYGALDQPQNLYGWSKLCAENYLTASGAGVSLRYFNVFGPGEWTKGKMASVAYQANLWYYKNKNLDPFVLFPGSPRRDFIYLDDVVQANIHAMNQVPCSTVWDVGTGDTTSFEEVLDIFKVPYKYADPSLVPNGYQFFTCADRNKFMPGWSPAGTSQDRFKQYKKII